MVSLKQVTNPAEINVILQQYNISYKNGKIMGGKRTKRTKKIRKQKGGFTYKANLKRRGLSTTYRRSNTSRRTSKRV